jgi:hypothetical protein
MIPARTVDVVLASNVPAIFDKANVKWSRQKLTFLTRFALAKATHTATECAETHTETQRRRKRDTGKNTQTDRQTDRQTRDRAGIPELQHEPVWLVIDRAVRAPVKHIEMSEHLLRPIHM